MKGEQKFELRKDPLPLKKQEQSHFQVPKREKADLSSDPNFRRALGKAALTSPRDCEEPGHRPLYYLPRQHVAGNDRALPRTIEEMRHVSGIGERKLELYGEQFLALILDHLREHAAPSPEKEAAGMDLIKESPTITRRSELNARRSTQVEGQQKAEIIRLIKEGQIELEGNCRAGWGV